MFESLGSNFQIALRQSENTLVAVRKEQQPQI
jgi:hypothetical protein